MAKKTEKKIETKVNQAVTVKPVLTEKSIVLSQTQNKYTFDVPLGMNKIQVAGIVETNYKVKVTSVNVKNQLGKIKFFGRNKRTGGRQSALRRAIVTLKTGDTISDFNVK